MANEEIAALLKNGQFQQAERKAIQQLQEQRLNAQMWVYLGEALLRQGLGRIAAQVFQRAHLLDPEASWVQTVNQELHKTPQGNGLDRHPEVKALLSRRKVTVAAALLVRNEIRCVERCLRSLVDAVDEIVVIDCESTDGTREVVESFPQAKLISFHWCDDFSAARNAGLPHIQSDWVIWIDADEELIPEDQRQIREAAAVLDQAAEPVVALCGVLEQMGEHTSMNYAKSRMFAMRHHFKFHGRVHEQIRSDEPSIVYEIKCMALLIRFRHDGYDPKVMRSKDKLARNLRLLEMMVAEEPENPAWRLFYGRETYGAGEAGKALEILKEADKLARQKGFSRGLEILALLIGIHISRKEWIEAEDLCKEALRVRFDFPDALYYMSQIELNKAREHNRNAEIHLRKVREAARTYRGAVSPDSSILTWKTDLALAGIARSHGKLAVAKQIYLQVLAKHPQLRDLQKPLELIEEQRVQLNASLQK